MMQDDLLYEQLIGIIMKFGNENWQSIRNNYEENQAGVWGLSPQKIELLRRVKHHAN